jgi:ornithine cyclodeaminase/alanine dehydrogenase-like protein (mu-crystallin family)
VTELGSVLAGSEKGRRDGDEITVFDSTGLAIQDLAVALAVLRRFESDPDSLEQVDVFETG